MAQHGSPPLPSSRRLAARRAATVTGCVACGYEAWDRLVFASHGSRVEIRVEPDGLLDQVRAVLPPGAVEADPDTVDAFYRLEKDRSAPQADVYRVVRDGDAVLWGASLRDALLGLGNALHYGVAANSPTMLFVHAGVVAWRDTVCLLPGQSRSGKSSLVDALVHAGATYFSDEGAPIDQEGLVHPYLKPLWLRADHPKHRHPAHNANRRAAGTDERLPVGLIMFLEYRPGTDWAPRRLTPGHALLRLVANTVLAATCPERTLAVLSQLAMRAPAYATERPEADEVAHELLTLLESHASNAVSWAAASSAVRSSSFA